MTRFYRRGVTKFVACPSVAIPGAPSRAELTAGVVLTGIADVKGFSITNAPVKTPDLDSRFTSSVPGEDSAADCSLTFWDDKTTSPASRTTLAKDTNLVLVYMPYGDVPTKRCETWSVTSTGVNDQVDMSAAGQFLVGFSVNTPPTQNAVIPA